MAAVVDKGEQCTSHCVSGQPPPAPVRGETRQTSEVLYQGESAESAGPGPYLGGPGWKTRDHCEKHSRLTGQTGLGFLPRPVRPSLWLLSGETIMYYVHIYIYTCIRYTCTYTYIHCM